MNTLCFEYHCHCPNKSQAHYRVENRLMIYLQAQELFTENIS